MPQPGRGRREQRPGSCARRPQKVIGVVAVHDAQSSRHGVVGQPHSEPARLEVAPQAQETLRHPGISPADEAMRLPANSLDVQALQVRPVARECADYEGDDKRSPVENGIGPPGTIPGEPKLPDRHFSNATNWREFVTMCKRNAAQPTDVLSPAFAIGKLRQAAVEAS